MTCTRYPDDDVVMRYVTSDLAEPDQSAFEDHLFACDTCLARVERYQAAQQALAARELPVLPTVVASRVEATASPRGGVAWWMLAAAAGVILAVAAVAVFWRAQPAPAPQQADRQAVPQAAPTPTPTPEPTAPASGRQSRGLQVAVLAMVTPPPYLPLTTRGAADDASFARGMDAYTRQDWATASRALATVDTPAARFYQGVADLMRGDAESAATQLQAARTSTVAAYRRESAFYLGKAALLRGDVAAARTWFDIARTDEATTAKEAARLLAALDELETR